MVGFNPDQTTRLPEITYSVCGAASGITTRAIVQPLDVLKIRFQIHLAAISPWCKTAQYTSILQSCQFIYKTEGLGAFWKGHIAAQGLSVVYGVVQFGLFEALTRVSYDVVQGTKSKIALETVCGALAGCASSICAQPLDVLRTRFVTQGKEKVYISMPSAVRSMLQLEGWRSFYKGLVPTLVQIAPYAGLQFGFYSCLTSLWREWRLLNPGSEISGSESLISGSLAGLGSKLAVYPFDLAKKRLQVQGFEKGWMHIGGTRVYTGLISCFKSVVKEEGLLGLYKGLAPSLMKAMVSTGLSFWSYEQCWYGASLLRKEVTS